MDRLLLGLVVVVGVPAATVAYVAAIEFVLERMPNVYRTRLRPWLWLLPAFLLLGFYLVYPTINTIFLSFQGPRSEEFVGLDNWIFAFTNNEMLTAFRNNAMWLVFFTAGTVLFGLLIALMADRVQYESAIKGLIFLPLAISYVAAGVIWKLMYEFEPAGREQTGTVNAILTALIPDFEPVAWLVNTTTNNLALILIGIWMWTGFSMVILSAGLKSIPEELIEAARVDGASELEILRNVTLPLLRPTIAVVTTTMVINVLKIFDIVYVLTSGNFNTEVIANRMYEEMFIIRNFGRSSAIAVLLFLATVPVMLYNVRRFQEQEEVR